MRRFQAMYLGYQRRNGGHVNVAKDDHELTEQKMVCPQKTGFDVCLFFSDWIVIHHLRIYKKYKGKKITMIKLI